MEEDSFHKGKRKTQLKGNYDDKYGAELNKQYKNKRMNQIVKQRDKTKNKNSKTE